MKKNEFDNIYNVEVQKYLLSCLIDDSDLFVRCRNIIKDDYFDDQLRKAVRFILDHADQYREVPSPELISAKSGLQIKKLSDYDTVLNKDWFLTEMEGFCRYKALENIVLEGYDLLQKGENAQIESRVKEAMMISLMSDLGTSYFDDPKTRLERLLDKSSIVSTGWQQLDEKLYGGFTRGGLNIFAGNSGSGKSLVLQNLALNWVTMGHDVIYFSLELSEDLIALRLDSMVTGKSTKEVFRTVGDSTLTIKMQGKKSGSLTIKKMPEGGTTANTLRAYIKEYQIKTGRKPACIIVDYLDMMYPNNKMDISNLFVKDQCVSEELRGLMHETDTFGATASQLNRQSIEAQGEFDQSHVAGGISKINTSDNFMAIFAPPSKRMQGEFAFIFLKTRSSSAVGQRIVLHYDPLTMKISDKSTVTIDIEKPIPYEEIQKQSEDLSKAFHEVEDWMSTYNSTDNPEEKAFIAMRLREQAMVDSIFDQACRKREDYANIIFSAPTQAETRWSKLNNLLSGITNEDDVI